jgi:ABC-2 type transport system permease protein
MSGWLHLAATCSAKDWRLFWADRRAVVIGFVVPVVLGCGFAVARPADAPRRFCEAALLGLLFGGVECGSLLLRERTCGVWLRMRAAPVPPAAAWSGKALVAAVVVCFQAIVALGAGHVLFGVTALAFVTSGMVRPA